MFPSKWVTRRWRVEGEGGGDVVRAVEQHPNQLLAQEGKSEIIFSSIWELQIFNLWGDPIMQSDERHRNHHADIVTKLGSHTYTHIHKHAHTNMHTHTCIHSLNLERKDEHSKIQ